MIQDWGTVTQRLSAESHRAFDACNLCLYQAQNPLCCRKGHIFCKTCILDNIITQKKEIKKAKATWQNTELPQLENQASEKLKLLEQSEVPQKQDWQKFQEHKKYGIMKEEEKTLAKARHSLKKPYDPPQDKLSSSFWVPELTPANKPSSEKPNKKLVCPSKPHTLQLKSLVELKPEVDPNTQKYVCSSCKKALTHQACSAVKPCGHLFCKKCIKTCDFKTCFICSKEILGVIDLDAGGTMYASHNQVQAKVSKPVFQC